MNQKTTIQIFCQINPSEDPEKVKSAINNIFPEIWSKLFSWLLKTGGDKNLYFRLNKDSYQQGEEILITGSSVRDYININNQALGMVRQWQDMNYGGRHSASTYSDSLPDFVKLAKSYGHVGMKVTKQSQLKSTFEKTFAMKDQLVFVDVYVDPDEHVYPMLVAPNGSMKDMWIKKNTKA